MSKLGLNSVLGSVRDYNRWLNVMRGMKKSAVHTIVTGGTEFEREREDVIRVIEEVGRDDCLYAHRYFRPEQGNWSLPGVSAKIWQPIYNKIVQHPQIITEIPINEPSTSEHPDFVKLQVDHLKAANDAGHAMGLAVQGVGGPHESFIDSGGFDDMYKAIADANRGQTRRMAYLHKHEYRWGWAECGAGFDDVPYRAMLSPQILADTMKSKADWNVRRDRWLTRTTDFEALHVRDVLDIPWSLFPVIHTEWGDDGVDDPINKLNQMILWNYELTTEESETLGISRNAPHWRVSMFADRLRDKFIRPPANGMRGWGAWRNFYEAVFPGMSWEDVSRLLMRHDNFDILHPSYIVGATYYVWAYHGEWGGEHNSSRHNFGEEGLDDVLMEAGSWDDDIINPEPEPEPAPIPVPVPVGTIDLLPYLRGDGRIYDMQYSWLGGGTQRIQTQVEGTKFFQVKGHPQSTAFEWEELWYDGVYIYRGTDISPSPDELYQTKRANGTYGEHWFKHFAKLGDTLRSVPTITFRYKRDGAAVPNKAPYAFAHHIRLTAIYPEMTFKSGIKLNDVIQLTAYEDNNGQPGTAFEVYYYAKNYGLVAWKNPTVANTESYISSQSISRPNLPRLKLSWLILPDVPDHEPVPLPVPTPEPTFIEVRIQSKATDSNGDPVGVFIRSAPTIPGDRLENTIGSVKPPPTVTIALVSDAFPTERDGYVWREVRIGDLRGWIAWTFVRMVSPIPEPTTTPVLNEDLKILRGILEKYPVVAE